LIPGDNRLHEDAAEVRGQEVPKLSGSGFDQGEHFVEHFVEHENFVEHFVEHENFVEHFVENFVEHLSKEHFESMRAAVAPLTQRAFFKWIFVSTHGKSLSLREKLAPMCKVGA
jgi:hypothetical protein